MPVMRSSFTLTLGSCRLRFTGRAHLGYAKNSGAWFAREAFYSVTLLLQGCENHVRSRPCIDGIRSRVTRSKSGIFSGLAGVQRWYH